MSEDSRPPNRLGRLLDRLSFASPVGESRAETWRENVLELGLRVCVVLGAVVYVPSVAVAVQSEKWVVTVVDTVALAAAVALHRARSAGYRFRAVTFSLVLYALGVALLVEVGPVSQIYLFGFSVIATLLLGARVGVLAVALNAASLLIVGLAGHGATEMAVSWHPTGPTAWVVITMNFVLVNFLLVVAVGVVLATLERIARHEREARDQLERERAELVAANAALDHQMRERQSLEDQLVQARKMEAVGQLAGGVAHDFNNLLTVINGYSELLLHALPEADDSRAMVAQVRDAGERAAKLTRQLLAFGRRQVLAPQVLDPNAAVASIGALLARLIGEDVRIATVLRPGVDRIRVDPGQFEQVVLNLAVNARDAMPTGGCLTIETVNLDLTPGEAPANWEAPPGAYVGLLVSDTGCGMTAEVRSRIFEPFFTTKEPGKGTGLGLSTVFGIVKQSDGCIDVYSEVGVGTCFKILFPAVADPARPPAPDAPPVRRGAETVLLVEDEPGVRGLARRALESHGYRVLAAANGADALRLFAAGGGIELVVTDVVMPGVSGRELVEQIRRTGAAVKVLYMSGYTDDAVVRHGIIDGVDAFLQKPFSPMALVRKVREVLDARPG
ncbi:multi-sensor hybrid histidine kinase : Multi-sensor hybrid histidine kinase OS=Koribacter versatilis (strain Ellin345) GN=Acid345_3014 PE=4 SV=1: HisKA: HATPase_c: Response_reg [Gemmataceae bacterium]|nr:multi-sensor hybrid histidine kinase : Multi-sensor hybrid histidine kinase OS=Koribacter versatilis (strain Ellin345) GN=Acid345_3014 PE=4 SV=1: HisKA: HATPase_c: Response_reg [Gemmataceae bacterium]VTT98742.1 multi-sensor hybrid histidine kinase : Multi-sensor hybrid histidine kinase OS=Koribacter versatilis (strain Ellin345) GN=Acid345_3014 PE=4 SV=1: HisKA: HATPase_c: Response_reg [Gemmataceae bacterium]